MGLLDFELYVVTSQEFSAGRSTLEVVQAAMAGGAGCIQLREKHCAVETLEPLAHQLREITAAAGVTYIINDHLDLALHVGADGVHLGQGDMPLQQARERAGASFIIGISTHSLEQALEAQEGGASYVNVGPIFGTQTKTTATRPLGPQAIRGIAPSLRIPFTVMGGIKPANVDQVVAAGADRIAVVTAVTAAPDIRQASHDLLLAIQHAKQQRKAS